MHETKQLAGKVALVTGGSRGIGAAIARRLAHDGATVAFTYANATDRARVVAEEIDATGGRALVIRADSADPVAVAAAVAETVATHGRIDILVNNAGIYVGGPLDKLTVEDADRIWAVDARAVFVACQAAARHMKAGSRIITIGTNFAEHVPGPGFTLYAMCKAALVGLTKGLARDLGPLGIGVVLVNPGPTDTEMNPADGPGGPRFTPLIALGHYGRPEDVAAVVSNLAGEGGHHVTGTTITVDGGMNA
ncbi:MAG TPA: SDR family oxidoreductase [Streptosporangiaceae bacterium]|nr:SDR family oxidoreductase [Streptosporangiaceae bacterium]